MKCLACNNEIPDASVVCPFCNRSVTPTQNPMPVFNVGNTGVLGSGVDNQVTNQYQNLNNAVNNGANQAGSMMGQNSSLGSSQGENSFQSVNPLGQVGVMPEMPMDQNNNGWVNSVQNQVANNQNANFTPGVGMQGVSTPQVSNEASLSAQSSVVLENDIKPEYIAPSGESVESVKLRNTLPKNTKKKKTKLIIIIVVLLLLVIGGGAAFFYYNSQYKTSAKRIDAVVNGLSSPLRLIKNDTINKTSGTYALEIGVSYADKNIDSKIKGTYATDLKASSLDLTVDLESLNMPDAMINSPVNLEFYYNDSKMYVLFQNFYDNYIYDEVLGLDDLFDTIKKNDINYLTMINGIKAAFGSSLKAMNNTQKTGNVNIHGQTKKANIIVIPLSSNNVGLAKKSFYRSLANNPKFVAEYAKLINRDEEVAEDLLLKNTENVGNVDINGSIEIYTEMFKEEFIGMKIADKSENKNVIEIYPVAKGYGISYKKGNQNIFECQYAKTMKNTSTIRNRNYQIDFTTYSNEQAYKVNIKADIAEDVNPKDAKVVVKNSIKRQYISFQDRELIKKRASEIGVLGLYLPEQIDKYLMRGIDSTTDACLLAINCVDQNNGTSICRNSTTGEQITCPSVAQ